MLYNVLLFYQYYYIKYIHTHTHTLTHKHTFILHHTDAGIKFIYITNRLIIMVNNRANICGISINVYFKFKLIDKVF